MSTSILDTARALPLSERIELVEALWESIIQEGYEPTLTTAQADELDRRLGAHEKNPDDVVAWETVKADLESKYGKS
jgi:putative addiction module component (TIGR02574 family)